MKIKIIKIWFILIILISCDKKINHKYIISENLLLNKTQLLSDKELKNWYVKDILDDTISGISLDKVNSKLIRNNKGKNVVIAVIDTEIDTNHEDLKGDFWVNNNEIPNNGLDDDKNGYIDDTHGWNFIGNIKGDNIIYSSFESTRIIKEFKNIYENKIDSDVSPSQLFQYNQYKRALQYRQSELKTINAVLKRGPKIIKRYKDALQKVSPFLDEVDFTQKKLDSLKKEHNNLEPDINFLISCIQYNLKLKDLEKDLAFNRRKIDIYHNLDYNDRKILNENSNDLHDTNYGNNSVNSNSEKLYHGTEVAGVLAAKKIDNIKPKGFGDFIKIMPLCISSNGDEHDKDIALAIRYAVNNGAKIINITFGKTFSLRPNWVNDAIKYAESNDILIVCSAGNGNLDLDIKQNYFHPKDTNQEKQEIVGNFIRVGASGHKIDSSLKASFSNYGKTEVDVFAPGVDIYTLMPNNKYKSDSGTSLSSPIVSGIAALLLSQYPDLKASQVKQIIMDSGVEYTIPQKIRLQGTKKDTLIPFNQLSKSGKIVNAYNALIMADSIARRN